MTKSVHNVPDLLRRFVTTPFRCEFDVGAIRVHLESNDQGIVAAASALTVMPIAAERQVYAWKLIRDPELSTHCAISVLVSDDLFTVLRGDGVSIVLDQQRREVIGFVAADVGKRELQTKLLPLIATSCTGRSYDVAEQSKCKRADGQ